MTIISPPVTYTHLTGQINAKGDYFLVWIIIILSSLLFGLAHTYQGITGVVRTTIFGVLFSILYIGIGSILPLIVFHFLIDYMAKLGETHAQD